MTLKEVLEAVAKEVAEAPEWVRDIHRRNDALEELQRKSEGDAYKGWVWRSW